MFVRFKELSVGDTFDFVDDENLTINSYFYRCRKTGTRTYEALDGDGPHTIGTVNCKVFHVEYAPIKL